MAKKKAKRVVPQQVNDSTRNQRREFPVHTLQDAVVIADAIASNNGRPFDRLLVADRVGRTPSSSEFKLLLSSSIKYGLTTGNEKSDLIALTDRGRQYAQPESDEERNQALLQAFMQPEIFRRILEHYNRGKIPDGIHFKNSLIRQFGVDPAHADNLLEILLANINYLQLGRSISGSLHLMLAPSTASPDSSEVQTQKEALSPAGVTADQEPFTPATHVQQSVTATTATATDTRLKRVFITHGKNKTFIDPIRQFLKFGDLEAEVSAERSTVAQGIPKKVMGDMRTCGASIIHIDAESELIDKDGQTRIVLNENVLIEIGASMALYGDRFILLVREGTKLPSNLQGLSEVRYTGDSLDAHAVVKLMQAIADLKNHTLP
ncbi:MAG: TIR domain-containing protein [Tepidisphaeraceae bacterium]